MEGYWQRAKTTEDKALVVIYCWIVLLLTINSRPLTGGTYLIWEVVKVKSGKDHA